MGINIPPQYQKIAISCGFLVVSIILLIIGLAISETAATTSTTCTYKGLSINFVEKYSGKCCYENCDCKTDKDNDCPPKTYETVATDNYECVFEVAYFAGKTEFPNSTLCDFSPTILNATGTHCSKTKTQGFLGECNTIYTTIDTEEGCLDTIDQSTLESGSSFVCYYQNESPDKVSFQRDPRAETWIYMGLLPLLISACCVGVAFKDYFKR